MDRRASKVSQKERRDLLQRAHGERPEAAEDAGGTRRQRLCVRVRSRLQLRRRRAANGRRWRGRGSDDRGLRSRRGDLARCQLAPERGRPASTGRERRRGWRRGGRRAGHISSLISTPPVGWSHFVHPTHNVFCQLEPQSIEKLVHRLAHHPRHPPAARELRLESTLIRMKQLGLHQLRERRACLMSCPMSCPANDRCTEGWGCEYRLGGYRLGGYWLGGYRLGGYRLGGYRLGGGGCRFRGGCRFGGGCGCNLSGGCRCCGR